MNTSTLLLSDFELDKSDLGFHYKFKHYSTKLILTARWPFHKSDEERFNFLRTFLPDDRIRAYWFPYSETEEEAFLILLKCIGEYNKAPFTKINR